MSNKSKAVAPKGYRAEEYPPFAVTADIVMLTMRQGRLSVLLVARGEEPYKGEWALPGGFVRPEESCTEAAARELAEETGLDSFGGHLEQLQTFDDPVRDPRMRVVSVAYLAMLPDLPLPQAGSDAAGARWFAVDELAQENIGLAFDHAKILEAGLERVANKLEYTSLATCFVPEPFTITELRHVYEAVWGISLDPGNFRRKVLATPGFVQPTGDSAADRQGRPASLYTAGGETMLHPPILRS